MKKYKVLATGAATKKTYLTNNFRDMIALATDRKQAGFTVKMYTLNKTTGKYEEK